MRSAEFLEINSPRNPAKNIITNKNWIAIALYSAAITLSVIVAVYYCKAYIGLDNKIANNMAFITLAFAQLFHVFNMSSPHSKFVVNEITTNKFIWLALLLCSGLILLVYAVPQMRLVLGLAILPGKAWLASIVAASLPLLAVQLYKIIFGSNKIFGV